MPFMRKCQTCGSIEAVDNTIWLMHVACWISKATDAQAHARTRLRTHANLHSEICNTYCLSTAVMVSWMLLSVTSFIHCLSCYNLAGVCLLGGANWTRKYNLAEYYQLKRWCQRRTWWVVRCLDAKVNLSDRITVLCIMSCNLYIYIRILIDGAWFFKVFKVLL
jgi:hypothetical protein